MKKQKGSILSIVFVIAGAAILISGTFIGCKDKEEKPDYKSMLKDAALYIENIEQENLKLVEKIKALEITKDKSTKEEETQYDEERIKLLLSMNKSMAKEKKSLEKEITALKSTTNQNKGLTEEIAKLKSKNQKLIEQNEFFEKEIASLRSAVQENENLTKQIAKLEKENQSLIEQKKAMKARLDKIQKMFTSGQATD